jgi:hypothetical protein
VFDLGVASGQQCHSQVAALHIDASCIYIASPVLHLVCCSAWLSWMKHLFAQQVVWARTCNFRGELPKADGYFQHPVARRQFEGSRQVHFTREQAFEGELAGRDAR